jgi:hypothetical protein
MDSIVRIIRIVIGEETKELPDPAKSAAGELGSRARPGSRGAGRRRQGAEIAKSMA